MSEDTLLQDRLKSDPGFRSLIEGEGLEAASPSLQLRVRRLHSRRNVVMAEDIGSSEVDPAVARTSWVDGGLAVRPRTRDDMLVTTSTSLVGEAVLDGNWLEDFFTRALALDRAVSAVQRRVQGWSESDDFAKDGPDAWSGDRVGIWNGADGTAMTITMRVYFYPNLSRDKGPPCLAFEGELRPNRWYFSLPLPVPEFEALCRAVEDDRVQELEATIVVTGLFRRIENEAYSPRDGNDYFALPSSFVKTGKLPEGPPPFPITALPCEWVRLSLSTATMIDRRGETAARGREDSPDARAFLTHARDALATLQGIRDAVRLLVAVLLALVVILILRLI